MSEIHMRQADGDPRPLDAADVTCPHCDTALAPEPIAPGVLLCPCCASVFETRAGSIVTAHDSAKRPAGRFSDSHRSEG